jgi:hypothetical protein
MLRRQSLKLCSGIKASVTSPPPLPRRPQSQEPGTRLWVAVHAGGSEGEGDPGAAAQGARGVLQRHWSKVSSGLCVCSVWWVVGGEGGGELRPCLLNRWEGVPSLLWSLDPDNALHRMKLPKLPEK